MIFFKRLGIWHLFLPNTWETDLAAKAKECLVLDFFDRFLHCETYSTTDEDPPAESMKFLSLFSKPFSFALHTHSVI